MENYTLYTHHTSLTEIEALLRKHLPKAKVEIMEPEARIHSFRATLKGGFFSKTRVLSINVQLRPTPGYQLTEITDGFTQNLAGLVNFVQTIPCIDQGLLAKLCAKIGSVNTQIAFMAEPDLTPEMSALLLDLSRSLEAVLFAQPGQTISKSDQPHFLNQDHNLLVDVAGNTADTIPELKMTVDASYHEHAHNDASDGQLARKERSIKKLTPLKIPVLKQLPVIEEEDNITLRTKEEVIERTYALLIVAAKGGGLPQEQVEATISQRGITGFTAKEQVFIDDSNPDDDQKHTLTWRYEAVGLLAWALNLVEELPLAADMVDVDALISFLMKTTKEELQDTTILRNKGEILDELDLTYRMHWACVNARVKGEHPPELLHPGVVYERYYTLNWLVRQYGETWDNVDTPT